MVFQLEVRCKVDRILIIALQKGTTARWYTNKTSLVDLGFTTFRIFLPKHKLKFQFSLFNWKKCLFNWSQSVEHNKSIWFDRLSEIKWTSPSNDTQHHPPVSVKVLITWVLAWYCMKPNILWFVPVGGSNGCILVTLVSCHHLNIVNTQH